MIFCKSITTAVGKDKSNPVATILPVCKGLIYRLEIDFPPGCCGLLHVQIFDGRYQVWPSTRGESFHGDACVVAFDDCYLKTAAPWVFKIITWNEDDTWNHTTQVRIGIASSEAFMSRYMPSITWDKFQSVLDRTALEQEAAKRAALEESLKELTD